MLGGRLAISARRQRERDRDSESCWKTEAGSNTHLSPEGGIQIEKQVDEAGAGMMCCW